MRTVYDMGDLEKDHPALWAPAIRLGFAARLSIIPGGGVRFQVHLRTDKIAGKRTKMEWEFRIPGTVLQSEVDRYRTTYGDKVITENAAIALAAALIADHLGMTILDVTLSGERGDYWLAGKDGNHAGDICEISGTLDQSLGALFEHKRRQVLKNRTASRCFVAVANFRDREGVMCRVR